MHPCIRFLSEPFQRRLGAFRRPASVAASTAAPAVYACALPSHLFVVRHGARLDQLQPSWLEEAALYGHNPADPPLSPLGNAQARGTGAWFKALPETQRPSRLLTSPYWRVLQTAAPVADALELRLEVEEGLAELHHIPGRLPTPAARFAYCPQVNPASKHSMLPTVATDEDPTVLALGVHAVDAESYPEGYFARVRRVAPALARACDGHRIACFSHAASTALVAALLDTPNLNKDVGAFAPCGVFHLIADGGGAPWRLVRTGHDNGHCGAGNHPATYPWLHPPEADQLWYDTHGTKRAMKCQ